MRPGHAARRSHRYWLPLLLGLVLAAGVLVLTVPRATAEPGQVVHDLETPVR